MDNAQVTQEAEELQAAWDSVETLPPDIELTVDALKAWAEHIGSGYSCPAAAQTMLVAADHLVSLARHRLERSEPVGWMGIESAPKDGTDFLVCDTRLEGGFVQVVFYKPTETNPDWMWATSDGPTFHKDAFTHWMPLPSAPGTTTPEPVAEIERLREENEALRDVLSNLASYLGTGMGDDSTTPEQFDARIRWGIDHNGRVAVERAAQVVEECSKRPGTTWGEVKQAILDDICFRAALGDAS